MSRHRDVIKKLEGNVEEMKEGRLNTEEEGEKMASADEVDRKKMPSTNEEEKEASGGQTGRVSQEPEEDVTGGEKGEDTPE
ncbi:hypothetical protein NDU88_004673 [Pleurodeles waltl]|uniref:Uncharacterized protein n=1 Tax=Pleurodeles waltl TaxID=8319 RepID=A0AAV7QCP6_PLEWA|nr:hypothetical protein NDU88_004673 [Pleurodeles waltl]